MLLLAAVAAFAQSDRPGPAPELVGEASRWGGEYLLGLGVGFGPHRVLGYGSVLGFDPLGFNLGAGYGNDALQAVGLYRQHSPGRLPYLDASDHRGGLLLLADYRSRVSLVADLSTLQLLRRAAAAYGVGLAAPMRFLDRTFIVEPRLLHGGLTRRTPELARDLIGYRFGDFSVGRLLGLLEGIRSDTGGTTALVLDLEARLHFLQTGGVPILDGIYVGTFADGGLFWDETRGAAPAGDFTVGGALGIDWLRVSLAVEAGYNHADAGFVWGVELKSFRYEANEEDDEDLTLPC